MKTPKPEAYMQNGNILVVIDYFDFWFLVTL